MTDKLIIEKICRDLDHELNAREKADLAVYLASNPEAAQIYQQQALIKKQLDDGQASMIEIDLKKDILNKIAMEGYKQPPKKDGVRIVPGFLSRPVVKFGFTFVTGFFLGFLIFSFLKADLSGNSGQTDQMKGTFYDSKSTGGIKNAGVLQYDNPVAKALVNVRYSTTMVEITAELNSSEPVKCNFQFDYNNFNVLNIQNVSVNSQTTALASGNFIQINNMGENKFLIYLANKNALENNIDFKIMLNDSPIFQNSVQVNKD
ncbi:MAG: hypothetical protein NTW16_16170 [Bacteroidetes bacterium]|nr:hypothetical protein [Bacteroidota bacterium]